MGGDMIGAVTIPLSTVPQGFDIVLAGRRVRIVTRYFSAQDAGWTLDITEPDGAMIVAGVPIVTGDDLLRGYKHLLTGSLYYVGKSDVLTPPAWGTLGADGELVYVA